MGNFLRRRRKPTEELENITTNVKKLEAQVKYYMEIQSDIIRTLIFTLLALFGVGISFLWYKYKIMLYIVIGSVLLGTILILFFILCRFLLQKFFNYLIERKQKKIKLFNERKITIIEDVKENEKFKVAKEIIKKYSNQNELMNDEDDLNLSMQNNSKVLTQDTITLKKNETQTNNLINQKKLNCSMTTMTAADPSALNYSTIMPKLHEINNAQFSRTPIRPFVEQTRNPIDRILDYVMGESINNRYALICIQCQTHNGMALREEFEKINYFCFKCGTYNPSKNDLNKTTNQNKNENNSPALFLNNNNNNKSNFNETNQQQFNFFTKKSINNCIKSQSNNDLQMLIKSVTRTPSVMSLNRTKYIKNVPKLLIGETTNEQQMQQSYNNEINNDIDMQQYNNNNNYINNDSFSGDESELN